MKAYETVFIVDPDISDDDVDSIAERLSGIVNDFNGRIVKIDKWGRKKLAYKVKKKNRGNYILLIFFSDHKLTTELERILKLDDRILKYLTVKVDKQFELDLLKEESAAATATEESAAAATEEVAIEEAAIEEEKDTQNGDVQEQE